MGLDTRAYRVLTEDERQKWVEETNEAGIQDGMGPGGIFSRKLDEPMTLDDAPRYMLDDKVVNLDWPTGLIGGMLSANGQGSFRGKAYANYVDAVMGTDGLLYQACHEPLQGERLQEVAARLRHAVNEPPSVISDDYPGRYEPEPEEREALAKWFEICANHGFAVSGDY